MKDKIHGMNHFRKYVRVLQRLDFMRHIAQKNPEKTAAFLISNPSLHEQELQPRATSSFYHPNNVNLTAKQLIELHKRVLTKFNIEYAQQHADQKDHQAFLRYYAKNVQTDEGFRDLLTFDDHNCFILVHHPSYEITTD